MGALVVADKESMTYRVPRYGIQVVTTDWSWLTDESDG
jgi:hypothetical protein